MIGAIRHDVRGLPSITGSGMSATHTSCMFIPFTFALDGVKQHQMDP